MREERLRDLGGLALEMYKRDRFNAGLVVERCAELVAIEARVQEIDALLDGSALVRRGGGGAVCICGAPILLGAQVLRDLRPRARRRQRRGAAGGLGRGRMTSCPRCGEPLAAGQEYCLVCGARVGDAASRVGTAPRTGWALRALATGVVALVGAAAAVAATGSDGGDATIVTAIGGFATAPDSAAGEAPVGPSGVAEWPTDEDGWTIALAVAAADGRARRPRSTARALRAAEGFRRSACSTRRATRASIPGYWIVFSGVYSSEAEATSALEDARRASRDRRRATRRALTLPLSSRATAGPTL